MKDPRARQRRLELGLLPDGLVPAYVEHFLVEVWRLHSVGRDRHAQELLMEEWSRAMDTRNAHAAPLALRLLERFGFITDDEEAWSTLPDEIPIYRAEADVTSSDGLCWTLDRSVAETLADQYDLTISAATVAKRDVLAYITRRQEAEVIVRKERVRDARTVRS